MLTRKWIFSPEAIFAKGEKWKVDYIQEEGCPYLIANIFSVS